jgi:DNA-binding response OmpR family regulator
MKKTILIVDNDEDWLSLLKRFFDSEGYGVLLAQDIAGALASLAAKRPACVIVDQRLGRENGMSICCSIKTIPELKDIPVIMLSGTSEAEDTGCGCTCDVFVCKADGLDGVAAAVKKVLGE